MSGGRSRSLDVRMRPTKRLIAAIAGILGTAMVMTVLGGLDLALQETGSDADPATAFSATEVVPRALAGRVEWGDDEEDLARRVEPATREQLTATWLRAHDALERAATGDHGGLAVWFAGPALDQALARYELGEEARVTAPRAVAHRLRVRFYSLDGQVAILTADTTYDRTPADERQRITALERVEAILVLADGNWRIRNLERSPADLIGT